jgi:hypothetical protein
VMRLWIGCIWSRKPRLGRWGWRGDGAADHLLAHVHVILRDGLECTVELDSRKIVGSIKAREIREPLQWIESKRAYLHKEWRRLNP